MSAISDFIQTLQTTAKKLEEVISSIRSKEIQTGNLPTSNMGKLLMKTRNPSMSLKLTMPSGAP